MATQFFPYDTAQFKRSFLDIPYADEDPRQILDLYLPDEGDGPFPLIVFVHGGGWVSGDKRENTMPGVFKVMSQGYAMAAIEYRLAPDNVWPSMCYDVKAAIRYLRAHAEEFNIKTDKIAAIGNSAGGHILNMVAATGGRRIIEDYSMGNPDETCAIQCLVNLYAPSDLYQIDLTNQLPEEELTDATGTDVGQNDTREGMNLPHNMALGFKGSRNPEAAAYGSPIHFVTEDFPPAYFLHGIADPVVPWVQSMAMCNKVNETCHEKRAKIELFPNAVHGDPSMKTDEVMNRILDFIDEHIWEGDHARTPLPPTESYQLIRDQPSYNA